MSSNKVHLRGGLGFALCTGADGTTTRMLTEASCDACRTIYKRLAERVNALKATGMSELEAYNVAAGEEADAFVERMMMSQHAAAPSSVKS